VVYCFHLVERWLRMPAKMIGEGPNPSGLCMCGCGRPTAIAKQSESRNGVIAGKPHRYLPGHGSFRHPQNYIVDESGCWVWQGRKGKTGYGAVGLRGRVHRVFYERLVGPIPDGMELDHICRNRACVNPDHLEPVTHRENMRRAGMMRLDAESVVAIRRERTAGSGVRELGRKFGVSHSTISAILAGKTWRDVRSVKP